MTSYKTDSEKIRGIIETFLYYSVINNVTAIASLQLDFWYPHFFVISQSDIGIPVFTIKESATITHSLLACSLNICILF